jgi:hypothetical protein
MGLKKAEQPQISGKVQKNQEKAEKKAGDASATGHQFAARAEERNTAGGNNRTTFHRRKTGAP